MRLSDSEIIAAGLRRAQAVNDGQKLGLIGEY